MTGRMWAYQNMTLMKGPHCTALRSQTIQLLGCRRGMAKNAITTKGAMMKKVMKTATLPTIDKPLHPPRSSQIRCMCSLPDGNSHHTRPGKIHHLWVSFKVLEIDHMLHAFNEDFFMYKTYKDGWKLLSTKANSV